MSLRAVPLKDAVGDEPRGAAVDQRFFDLGQAPRIGFDFVPVITDTGRDILQRKESIVEPLTQFTH